MRLQGNTITNTDHYKCGKILLVATGSLNINLTFEHRRASQTSGDSNPMLHVRHVLQTNH